MARIPTANPKHARGVRRLVVWVTKRQYGGIVPGIYEVLGRDLKVALPASWLYTHLHLRKT